MGDIATAKVVLIGFSKGGLPMTALLEDDSCDDAGLKQRLESIHYVDVGLPGPGPAYASGVALQTLPKTVPVYVHLSDWIAKPAMGFWKEEAGECASAAKACGLQVEVKLYPGAQLLETH